MRTLWQDLRFGARMLLKKPGFTLTAVVTLALGIGANTAIFSVVDHLLVRTLPVPASEQLVNLSGRNEKGREDTSFSYPIYVDYRDQNDVLAGLLAYSETPLNLSEGGQTERIAGVLVSGNYFDVLGVAPALGRTFLPDEDQTVGTHSVAVVSYGLWQRRFGADPRLVGRQLTLNGYSFTVVGVAPLEFSGVRSGLAPDVYVPIHMLAQAWPTQKASDLNDRGFSWLNVMGRLKPGVTRAQAQAALSALSGRIERIYPGYTWPLIALRDGSRGETSSVDELSTPLKLLLAMVGLVLLVACVNLAHLMLVRAATRGREIGVRLALGASRGRLLRQLLTESLLLAVLGGGLGVLLAVWLGELLAAYSPPTGTAAPPLLNAELDWRVLGFTALLSLATGLLFGLAPAWRASRADVIAALKHDAATSAGAGRFSARGALVAAQLALSLVVLVCAGLCMRSLQNLQRIDAGFDEARVLALGINLSLNGYNEERGRQFYTQLLERVSSLPGVEAASLARIVPLGNNGMRESVGVEGFTPLDNKPINLDMNLVGPRYCATLKLPLAQGRDFTERDNAGAAPAVIINEAAARAFWPQQNPLGKHLSFGAPGGGQPKQIMPVG